MVTYVQTPSGLLMPAFAETQTASKPSGAEHYGEAAAAGGERDVTATWLSSMHRPNMDPVLAARGGGLELYEELLRDSSVQIAFQQRQLALIGKPLEVIAGGDDAASVAASADLQAQLNDISWDTITAAMLFGRIYGYATGECMWRLDGRRVVLADVKVRKARRFLFGKAGELLLRTIGKPAGEPLPDRKFWVYSSSGDTTDDPYGFGLGQILYWLVWFKRNDVKLWLAALDKFASPTAKGEFPPNAPEEEKNKLLQALSAIRHSSAVIIPQGFKVELLQAAATGAGDYSAAYKMLDEAITMVIAGQTMTSRQGSSEAQARVHQDVLGSIVKADDDVLSDSFNAGPARWLTAWNFPTARPPKIRRKVEPPEDLKAELAIDEGLIRMGYEPPENWLAEKYGRVGWKRAQGGGLGFGGAMDDVDSGAA